MTLEEEIVTKGLTAPRITPDHVENCISSEYYFTASEGVTGALREQAEAKGWTYNGTSFHSSLNLLTFCVLALKNGFTVTGESACASPENFDADIGRKIARENAVEKIWLLEGYLLKQHLHEQAQKNDLVSSLGEDDCEGCKI